LSIKLNETLTLYTEKGMVGKVEVKTPTLSVLDAIALIIGIVVGAGIFETPSLVATTAGSGGVMLLTWLLGGGISLVGALCYAELTTTYPHPGGNYYYFQRAFGQGVPLYPLTPLLFAAICAYMLQSSLAYIGRLGALVSVAVLLVGVPLLLLARRMRNANFDSRREK
jgi:amino acid transporter